MKYEFWKNGKLVYITNSFPTHELLQKYEKMGCKCINNYGEQVHAMINELAHKIFNLPKKEIDFEVEREKQEDQRLEMMENDFSRGRF